MEPMSVLISWRPRRSAVVTSRMSSTSTWPSKRSRTGGRTLTARPAARAQLAQVADQVGVGAGDGDEQGVGPAVGGGLGQAGAAAEDGDAHHPQVALVGVVVEQAHGHVVAGGVAQEGGDDLGAALARPEDEQPVPALLAGPQAPLDRQAPRSSGTRP